MEVTIAIIVSAIISSFVTLFVYTRKTKFIGTLVIDRSDHGEAPYPFLEISKGVGGIDGVSTCKYVVLAVENRDYIPQ